MIALRRSLMESEQKANLWKEQADETRTEYIQCKSNARILQIELDSTQKELARVLEDCKRQGHLIRDLRKEIEMKNSERLAEDTVSKDTGYKCSTEALETELKSTREELTRIKDEYEKQRRLFEEPIEEKKPHSPSDVDLEQIGLVKEPEDRLKRPPSADEEQAARVNEAQLLQDYFMAKELDEDLNTDKDEGEGVPNDFEGASSHHHFDVRSVAASDLWTGPVESQSEKARAEIAGQRKEVDGMESASWYSYQELYQQECLKHRKTSDKAQRLEMEFDAAMNHIQTLDRELKVVRNEMTSVKKQLTDAVTLLDIKKKSKGEPEQPFLTKADTLSIKDVVQKVNALNEEIFQMAAYLGEVLVYEVLAPDADRREHRQTAIRATYEWSVNMLGETLTNALAQESMNEPKEESNTLLVQIVMQIALANWCGAFGRRWTSYQRVDELASEVKESQPKESGSKSGISKQVEHDRFISELYDSIRDHEDQSIAGRWRSLTRAYLPFSTNGWDHSLMLTICSIMSVAGWATRLDEDIVQIEKRLCSIFKPLLDLRKAIGEDVISTELKISIISPGQAFNPSYMEDAYADGRSSSKSKKSAPETVVSTSELGLQRLVVKRLKAGGVQRKAEIVSMPKVVLEKTIKEALKPPPPAKRKMKKKKTMSGDPGAGSTGSPPGH
ncbi:hypothetical protein EST38_g1509 [Candolleomyces aberdarensis]|uniref:Uncharacterized protein n=1 Tax=Candolleomyces aberdarensis TaxID=2316362 RepID=A0A4Q2DXX6_9AGAR|nr:hypothetical protein EST38_g1509 [Candolleomyces aberdarensis]